MDERRNNWRFCVVGNIVHDHLVVDGTVYYGTKEFVGGTKVYIDGKNWGNYKRSKIVVIGLNRFKRYEIVSVDPKYIENVRFQAIFKPAVIQIMDHVEIMEGWHWWGRTADDKREAKEFVNNWSALLASI